MNEAVIKRYSLLDTLSYAKELISVGFTEKQAKVLANSQAEMLKEQSELVEKKLATKKDLELSIATLKKDVDLSIAKLKAETIKWMFGALTAQAIVIISVIKLF